MLAGHATAAGTAAYAARFGAAGDDVEEYRGTHRERIDPFLSAAHVLRRDAAGTL